MFLSLKQHKTNTYISFWNERGVAVVICRRLICNARVEVYKLCAATATITHSTARVLHSLEIHFYFFIFGTRKKHLHKFLNVPKRSHLYCCMCIYIRLMFVRVPCVTIKVYISLNESIAVGWVIFFAWRWVGAISIQTLCFQIASHIIMLSCDGVCTWHYILDIWHALYAGRCDF